MIAPDYIGDGVYCTESEYGLMLTTSDHRREKADNVIFLEPCVIAALKRYLARMEAQHQPDNGGWRNAYAGLSRWDGDIVFWNT